MFTNNCTTLHLKHNLFFEIVTSINKFFYQYYFSIYLIYQYSFFLILKGLQIKISYFVDF